MAGENVTAPSNRKDRTHWLYIGVVVAVVLGIALGFLAPDLAVKLEPLGTAFVALIKMMISPVIFCTIVLGVGSVASAAQVGKVGGLALGYFLTMSTFALAIGLVGAQTVLFAGNENLGYALTAAVAAAGFGLYLRTAAWPYLVVGVLGVTLVVPEAVMGWTDNSLGPAGGVLVAGLTLLAASLAGLKVREEVTEKDEDPREHAPAGR
jgi:aerobic C4-dicarboxylate transport protein